METKAFTVNEMLRALDRAGSTSCALIAREIISGRSTVEAELSRNHGSFINAVLRGDYDHAVLLASGNNYNCLVALARQPGFSKRE